MNKEKLPVLLPAVAGAVLLLIATSSNLNYDYYIFLRWAITGISTFLAYKFFKISNKFWSWAFTVGSIIFNPILPLYLDKSTWLLIDVIYAVVLVASILNMKEK